MTKANFFRRGLPARVLPLALSLLLTISLAACGIWPGITVTSPSETPFETAAPPSGSSAPDGTSEPDGNGSDELPANPDADEISAAPPKVMDSPDSTLSLQGRPSILPTVMPTVTPERPVIKGPALPVQDRVDDDFFSDAAFLGNSLVDGFRLYSGLTTCDVYAATSMTVVGVGSSNSILLQNGGLGTIYQGVAQETYGKIYILLGINEIGYVTSSFKQMYGDMLDTLAGLQPDADIYVMSLTPVSEYKSSTDSTFSMSRVREYNEALYELAEEKGCYYIDLVEALSDDTGYLPSSVTSDGIHFSADHYKVWLEYLRTHYV